MGEPSCLLSLNPVIHSNSEILRPSKTLFHLPRSQLLCSNYLEISEALISDRNTCPDTPANDIEDMLHTSGSCCWTGIHYHRSVALRTKELLDSSDHSNCTKTDDVILSFSVVEPLIWLNMPGIWMKAMLFVMKSRRFLKLDFTIVASGRMQLVVALNM